VIQSKPCERSVSTPGLLDHAPVADEADALDPKAGLEPLGRLGQRLLVVDLAPEDLDRDRPAPR
jgi:hypothetical protein